MASATRARPRCVDIDGALLEARCPANDRLRPRPPLVASSEWPPVAAEESPAKRLQTSPADDAHGKELPAGPRPGLAVELPPELAYPRSFPCSLGCGRVFGHPPARFQHERACKLRVFGQESRSATTCYPTHKPEPMYVDQGRVLPSIALCSALCSPVVPCALPSFPSLALSLARVAAPHFKPARSTRPRGCWRSGRQLLAGGGNYWYAGRDSALTSTRGSPSATFSTCSSCASSTRQSGTRPEASSGRAHDPLGSGKMHMGINS